MRAFVEGVRGAFRAIRRNGLRAGLTVLGILIGVAAVVTVTALGAGARNRVGGQIESLGTNIIIVFPENAAASGAHLAEPHARLTEEDGRAIAREAVSVRAVAATHEARAQVIHGDRNWSTLVMGATLPYFSVANWEFARGGPWDEHDDAAKSKVCVIGKTVAKNLFDAKDPIGETVRIGRYPFRVVGVLTEKGNSPFGNDQDDIVVMPLASMRGRVLRTLPGSAGTLLLSATSPSTVERAVDQIESILRQRHRIGPDRTADFAVRTQKSLQQIEKSIFLVLTVLLVFIAGISLVVGGIGVMNIMLVVVTERTREIGIRMALGARESDIRTQFLVEAVVLSVVGGFAGVLLGLMAIAGLSSVLGWELTLDRTALVVSVGTTALIGIGFGFFPARRAAKMDPILALRHE